jgi:hypothetical protein
MKGVFITHTKEDWKIISEFIKATAMANWDNAERLVELKHAVLRAKAMELDIEETPAKK